MTTAPRTALTAITAVGAVGLGAAIWGVGVERYLFTVREHDLFVLPAGSRPLRALHISDAHMAPWQHRKQRWIASLAAFEPDLIVNTGDNLGHADGLAGLRRAFDGFRGIPGVFVHGSNDAYAPAPRNPLRYFTGPSKNKPEAEALDVDALDRYLSDELGWVGIDNTTTSLDVDGLRIDAFGVDDAHRHWDDIAGLAPQRAAQQQVGGAALTIGVSHAPYRRVLNAFTDFGADLIFAGHTHGGQVRIPLSPKALVANCDIPLDQARGFSTWTHDDRRVPLNVSAGIGHSIFAPVRFACRPEATLLTLRPIA
ncbi:metallophosphoesterase [Microbacterium sp. cx-59]|uniref:metallophosphoesterase n=1 Tax=Microbacterium sp. cx-59 TaxID=2891207 RepID=UPI001E32677C|nr:metallophosphoesterase [Microbacterium sp. cx-59]MCC4908967.1 metallophosphoesterase [Microbacterium sp. cx-59]